MMSRLHVSISAAVILCGVALSPAVPFVLAEEPPLEVIVKPGDTLNELCKQHLQDPTQCMEIARINQLKNPDRIEPGERIAIPATMLRTRPSPASKGTVAFIKGSVVARERDAAGWRLLSLKDEVLAGSRVRTGPDGSAELAFEDNSSLFLRPNTEIEVSALQRGDDGFVKRFFLEIGKLVSKTVKLASTPSRLEIKTHTAVAGTRGTRFGLTMLDDRTTRAEVQEGVIGVSAMGKEVEVREGEGTIVKQGMQPAAPSRLLPRPVPTNLKPHYSAMPVNIEITRIEGAHRYRAALTRDRDGRDLVAEKLLAPGEAFLAPDLQSGAYYLHLRSIDEQGLEGIEGEPYAVQVLLEQRPPAPQPVSEMPTTTERSVVEIIVIMIFVIGAMLF